MDHSNYAVGLMLLFAKIGTGDHAVPLFIQRHLYLFLIHLAITQEGLNMTTRPGGTGLLKRAPKNLEEKSRRSQFCTTFSPQRLRTQYGIKAGDIRAIEIAEDDNTF
jgi:hypothetical protein